MYVQGDFVGLITPFSHNIFCTRFANLSKYWGKSMIHIFWFAAKKGPIFIHGKYKIFDNTKSGISANRANYGLG